MVDAAPPVPTYESLAQSIEFRLLRPDLSDDEVAAACRTARELAVAAILVRPCDVDAVLRWMGNSPVAVASVAGFPDGSSTTAAKLYEARDLLRRGIRELEFVVNPGKLISRQFQHIETELVQVAESCGEAGVSLTIALHNQLLGDEFKIIALKIARRVGARSLSLTPADHDFELLRPLLKERVTMKAALASSLDEALRWQAAGCVRIGTEGAAELLAAWRQRLAALQRPTQAQAAPAALGGKTDVIF